MSDIPHGHRITTESFFNGDLMSSKQEIELSLFSSRETILKDIIEALEVISSGSSNKLDITIKVDTQGRYRISKRWIV